MKDILFIKTSSLGDVIHHMPAVTDARRARPDLHLSWVIEEAFAPLARLHPGIDEVIPVASRRWRKTLLSASTWSEMRQRCAVLRTREYDRVIDTQGLLRTGLIARLALGERHGYDRASIREPLASLFYDVRHTVSRELHAVERNRRLTALALGYEMQGAPDFGLSRANVAAPAEPYVVFLHATAQARKEWPVANWIALGRSLNERGLEIVLPWGTETERLRSEDIAQALPNARVPDRAPLDQVARLIANARGVVGVDTGLLHLAAAFAAPLVAIFAGSQPKLTGPVGAGPMTVLGTDGAPPGVDEVRAAVSTLLI
ncbi:lipopolysaccharide heptosyltransferase I [Undibacter mobilis]|uniref:Lipopolysaccharide heptosyltransferase 1 n=1 Tax=Undibacter mobilis TaxID=2292256 RepID=A0A371BCL8_9BRAD|nr:lipopolysaccharide heptosyltransferase I [Undibacter mobilis]RDV05101.1 lipopolysaccharide heptosyltransferase I [Undibacter mobilis]